MPIIEGQIEIGVAAEDAFDLAQDYALRLRWDPFLREMRFLDGAREAEVGVKVWVRAKNGLTMEVVYVTLDRPSTVAMKMTAGPRLFERFAGSWRFEPVAERRTLVIFRYNFETRWSRLRPLLNRAVGWVFGRDVRLRLAGLKHSAERTDILSQLRATRAVDGR